MNVFGENEIVTTVEYIQTKYDFWAKNKANQQNMDFIFVAKNIHFLIAIFQMPVNICTGANDDVEAIIVLS